MAAEFKDAIERVGKILSIESGTEWVFENGERHELAVLRNVKLPDLKLKFHLVQWTVREQRIEVSGQYPGDDYPPPHMRPKGPVFSCDRKPLQIASRLMKAFIGEYMTVWREGMREFKAISENKDVVREASQNMAKLLGGSVTAHFDEKKFKGTFKGNTPNQVSVSGETYASGCELTLKVPYALATQLVNVVLAYRQSGITLNKALAEWHRTDQENNK